MLKKIYFIASSLLGLVAPLWLKHRARKGKEDALRIAERYGKCVLPRPKGALIWFHAASMGESQSVMPIIRAWLKAHPQIHILLTTGTITSAKHVATRLPERALHQYIPLDVPWMVTRFMKHWQPDMVIFVDSEIWPNMFTQIGASDAYFALLNARISTRSVARWQKTPNFIAGLLANCDAIYAKSAEDASHFKALGAKDAISYGNLKFSSPPLQADPKVTAELINIIASRPVWLAASTHEGEEMIIGEVHHHIKEFFPDILTIIVPRHHIRGNDVCYLLERSNLQVSQRSKHMDILKTTDIYVADTMGELGIFYRVAEIAFIGGSLVNHGGQNPFEPARLDCAIIYGPHMHNFNEFCAELERSKAAIQVQDAETLKEAVITLLRDQNQQETLAKAALHAVQANANVIAHVDAAFAAPLTWAIGRYART
jgi:3-deoxy-D-manno-octulosonic-acid transferase